LQTCIAAPEFNQGRVCKVWSIIDKAAVEAQVT
jgi:predicted ester cyclase